MHTPHTGRRIPQKLLGTLLIAALAAGCASGLADAPPIAIAHVDTATPMPAAPAEVAPEAVRSWAAVALGTDPARIRVRRISSRDGLSAWRAAAAGATATSGRRVLAVVVDGEDVLRGRLGFVNWVGRHGRADPIATAIAYHVLVQGGTSEPYGSWTRGPRQASDPRYDQHGRLVFFHGDASLGQVIRTAITFGPRSTVIDAASEPVPPHDAPSG